MKEFFQEINKALEETSDTLNLSISQIALYTLLAIPVLCIMIPAGMITGLYCYTIIVLRQAKVGNWL